MQIIKTDLPEVLIVEPKLFGDQRGFFLETYQLGRYVEHGIVGPFVQDNMSRSSYGVLRGLHLQNPSTLGKLGCWMSRSTFGLGARILGGTLLLN
jgi:dTDP-4-dehydrorhamnose 3,5-epimerase